MSRLYLLSSRAFALFAHWCREVGDRGGKVSLRLCRLHSQLPQPGQLGTQVLGVRVAWLGILCEFGGLLEASELRRLIVLRDTCRKLSKLGEFAVAVCLGLTVCLRCDAVSIDEECFGICLNVRRCRLQNDRRSGSRHLNRPTVAAIAVWTRRYCCLPRRRLSFGRGRHTQRLCCRWSWNLAPAWVTVGTHAALVPRALFRRLLRGSLGFGRRLVCARLDCDSAGSLVQTNPPGLINGLVVPLDLWDVERGVEHQPG